jgi:aminoglycoside phosphotransferase (APT) family kinase protein
MPSEPWKSDRELNETGVRTVLGDQFPDLALRSIEHIGSGWDFDAYLINRRLVVRFPRRAEVAERLDQEAAILRLVRSSFEGGHLGPQVVQAEIAVPEIIMRGQGSAHFPHAFFGHVFIPGVAVDDPAAHASTELAVDLARALSLIHSITPECASAIGVGHDDERCETRFRDTLDSVQQAGGICDFVPDAHAWLHGRPPLPRDYLGPPRFIHGDLSLRHILIDREAGRLRGIIDWSDAAIGDPALDFVSLVLWRGWDFTVSVIRLYRPELDDGFCERLRFLARTLAVKWLADALRWKRGDMETHRSWVLSALAE